MPRIYALSLLFMVGLSGSVQASGGIYKWVDQNGITQYSQTPPPKNAKNSQTVRVSKHIPADVREGRARGMVDAATLQAYTAPNTNTATATAENGSNTSTNPASAPTPIVNAPAAPSNSAAPMPQTPAPAQ